MMRRILEIQHKSSSTQRNRSSIPHSFSYQKKFKEAYRIDRENIRLAERIINVKPNFKANEFRESANKHQYLSSNMNKIKREV